MQEKLGDAIVSKVDVVVSVARVGHCKANRVKVEMSGSVLGFDSR